MADPSYTLQIKQALAIKPKEFKIRVVLREGRSGATLLASPPSSAFFKTHSRAPSAERLESKSNLKDVNARQLLYVLYGGNTGTCEMFAQRIATEAAGHGFRAKMGSLDSVFGHLPKDGPLVIVTASFEGERSDLSLFSRSSC